MNYPFFIWAEGLPTPEALSVIQRELPTWIEEMDERGLRLGGRELDLPETASTVRVRRDEMLVTDGPFAETKEFLAGFDLLRFDDLAQAIAAAARNAIARFQAIEIGSFVGDPRLGEKASAFLRDDDSLGDPYLLSTWIGDAGRPAIDDEALMSACEGWRQELQERGLYILGGTLEDPGSAPTVRVRDGRTLASARPITGDGGFIAAIDVVACADRQQAHDLAAAHPAARYHAIEVRPFWREA